MDSTEQVVAARTDEAQVSRPIIVDLGKQRKKQIKRLKRGEGKLWDEVADVSQEVGLQLGEEAQDKVLVPIVMVYRKKAKKRKGVNPLFPLGR